MPKVTVIIPAYNPTPALVPLVKELSADFSVLVVNDGSGAEYNGLFDQARSNGAFLLEHGENKGKGAALKTAIKRLKEEGGDWVAVTADADGQHCVKDIKAVARAALSAPDGLVIGVRSFKLMPAKSRFGNAFTRLCFYIATRVRVSDTQTGLRGFSSALAERLLAAEGERYEYEINVLLGLKGWGVPLVEIPIETIYLDGNASSHFQPLRDSIAVLSQLIKHTAVSVATTVFDYLLYLTLIEFTPMRPEWAYFAARGASAAFNYPLSRRMVFHTKPSWRTTAAYFMLVVASVSAGTVFVRLFCKLGADERLIKLPIDVALFFANFIVQKKVIFNDKD